MDRLVFLRVNPLGSQAVILLLDHLACPVDNPACSRLENPPECPRLGQADNLLLFRLVDQPEDLQVSRRLDRRSSPLRVPRDNRVHSPHGNPQLDLQVNRRSSPLRILRLVPLDNHQVSPRVNHFQGQREDQVNSHLLNRHRYQRDNQAVIPLFNPVLNLRCSPQDGLLVSLLHNLFVIQVLYRLDSPPDSQVANLLASPPCNPLIAPRDNRLLTQLVNPLADRHDNPAVFLVVNPLANQWVVPLVNHRDDPVPNHLCSPLRSLVDSQVVNPLYSQAGVHLFNPPVDPRFNLVEHHRSNPLHSRQYNLQYNRAYSRLLCLLDSPLADRRDSLQGDQVPNQQSDQLCSPVHSLLGNLLPGPRRNLVGIQPVNPRVGQRGSLAVSHRLSQAQDRWDFRHLNPRPTRPPNLRRSPPISPRLNQLVNPAFNRRGILLVNPVDDLQLNPHQDPLINPRDCHRVNLLDCRLDSPVQCLLYSPQ